MEINEIMNQHHATSNAFWKLIHFSLMVISAWLLTMSTGCVAPQVDDPKAGFGINAQTSQAIGAISETKKPSYDTNPLDLNRRTYVLLQVDGGGIMGITPAIVLNGMEQELAKRPGCNGKLMRDHLSVCAGTSTGAILAGMVAAGVPAS